MGKPTSPGARGETVEMAGPAAIFIVSNFVAVPPAASVTLKVMEATHSLGLVPYSTRAYSMDKGQLTLTHSK